MKRTIFSLLIAILIFPLQGVFAQEGVESAIDEARKAYRAGDLEAARFNLQQAMTEVDLAIAREVLALLPTQMGDMAFTDTDETVGSAALGFAGLFVSRTYLSENESSASVQVIADSPLLAGINTVLSLPIGAFDSNQKRVRVGGYRGLLQKQDDGNGSISWDIQIPFGASLLSLNFKGIREEKDVLDMAGTIPIDQIARLVQ
jgi:hypothetical protein